jgi:hypothetical protein
MIRYCGCSQVNKMSNERSRLTASPSCEHITDREAVRERDGVDHLRPFIAGRENCAMSVWK